MLKIVLRLAALFLAAGSMHVALAQTTLSPGSAINIAGKQRFLTQRMGKDYVFKLIGKQAEVASREMQTSVILFEENLKALKLASPKSTSALLAREEALWTEYRKLLVAEPSKENAQVLLNTNSQLLAATNDVVVDLIKWAATQPRRENETGASAEQVAENTNQSGRMRMLSQRLTFYYGAYVAGLNTPNNDIVKQLQQMATGIQGGMSSLVTSEANTAEIDDVISGAIIDWRYIEERCTKNNCISFEEKSIDAGEVFQITNRMLVKMDKITGMYAKLLE
ncbi:type IV pili methyl-accepting chemotaxis transducer N-terminal domain-containing protein [Fibrella sp. HMF5335]|uniref:Type IV pili methyl-accepting chemotaxis transducer N-terminal domain-containing protein n=1 Tax=Fibrella rubiginis TaxID=2817060 RepID=A0A939K2G2_9BACT|nr:type IV pili methyl-accepting chemotaxis transducer N-terminal domain-containing protein [Fibrella rubiginis]MBO0938182.1 type IV pili methyl-accepting chemotaxis transducer N-terminal domain-containing protein [Fibrella rubiginis]